MGVKSKTISGPYQSYQIRVSVANLTELVSVQGAVDGAPTFVKDHSEPWYWFAALPAGIVSSPDGSSGAIPGTHGGFYVALSALLPDSPWSSIFTTALASKLIVVAPSLTTERPTIRSFSGRIDATAPTATYYVQLWRSPDVPAVATPVNATTAAMAPYKVVHVNGTDDQIVFDFGEAGIFAPLGFTVGLSTTEFTQTAAGAYLSLTAEFRS